MKDYLRNLDISDSFILSFERHGDQFWIRVLFSLEEGHPSYERPTAEDYACYKHGWIIARGVTGLDFKLMPRLPNHDPSGEIDFGSFDDFVFEQGFLACSGDWGNIKLQCSKLDFLIPKIGSID